MRLKRTVVAPALVAGVALVSGGWLLQRGVSGQESVFQRARIFDEVLHFVESRYVDQHSESELYQKAIEGMLQELGDPHTVFMTADEYAQLHLQTSGEYGGLGIQISSHEGYITAVGVLPGTPAERAGLRVGDQLLEVDGKDAKGWTDDFAVKVLRGPRGTPVHLKVRRVGVDEPMQFTIVRDEIHVQSVPYAYQVAPGIGYVRLNVFAESSTDEIRAAIGRLKEEGMRKLILDLRTNPGGLLDQGVSVSDLFLRPGQSIVETRSRNPGESETYRASTPETYGELPLVVLVDAYSASAAEIVAGALQDHDRALVVGTTSFGKGSVQSLFRLSGGNFLKMTTGKWYTPVGRSIQKPFRDNGAVGEEGTITPEGQTVPEDSTRRQPYRTDGGRTVYGGGGIVPDVEVPPDTATEAEKEFIGAVGKQASKFRDVVLRYAVEYERRHPNLSRDFPITPEMRRDVLERLRAAGVELTPEQMEGGRRIVDRELIDEIATSRFGQAVASMRDDVHDRALQEAIGLLQRSSDQASLFRAAQQQQQVATQPR